MYVYYELNLIRKTFMWIVIFKRLVATVQIFLFGNNAMGINSTSTTDKLNNSNLGLFNINISICINTFSVD